MRMGARDDLLVVGERALDEASHQQHVRHPEHELVVADRDLYFLPRADDAGDLLDRLARNDPRHGRPRRRELPDGQSQPMAVGRHHPQLLVVHREEHPVERVAAFVVGDRKRGLAEHVPQHLAVDGQPAGGRSVPDRRELFRGEPDQPIRRSRAPQRDPGVLLDLERQRRRRQLLHDLHELAGRYRDGARLHHLGRSGHPHADLEVGRGHSQRVALGFQQHVGQDRQRLPWLDHVVGHLQPPHERVTIHMHFHKSLRCSGIERKQKNSSS